MEEMLFIIVLAIIRVASPFPAHLVEGDVHFQDTSGASLVYLAVGLPETLEYTTLRLQQSLGIGSESTACVMVHDDVSATYLDFARAASASSSADEGSTGGLERSRNDLLMDLDRSLFVVEGKSQCVLNTKCGHILFPSLTH